MSFRLATLALGCIAAVGAWAADDALRACLDCHRSPDRRAQLPVLEGQNAEYLEAQLRRFRDRHRDSFPMSALVADWDDADASRYAALLAARPWRDDPSAPASPELRERGARIASAQACANCHGEDFRGAGSVPRIAGQHAGYLARQIGAFGNGTRHHPPTGVGARMYNLDAAEANAVAAWLQALPREAVSPEAGGP